MLSNVSEFEVLLNRYEDDPGVCSKMLRAHSLSDPAAFLTYAQAVLQTQPVSRAVKFVATLAIQAGIIPLLSQRHLRDREGCLALARKLIQCEPRFDAILLESLSRPGPVPALDETFCLTVLDIVDEISEGDLLVGAVLKFVKHPDPKVRSKAALFVGRRTQNTAWAVSRAQEDNARVRANILESLFDLNSEFVHQMFKSHVSDSNNRVVGNAIFGLYHLGDCSAVPLIYQLAKHAEARFRTTCTWVMKQSGDPRFLQALAELMKDPDDGVRGHAFKALGELKKMLRAEASRPELRTSITSVRVEAGVCTAAMAVFTPDGQQARAISATAFNIKAGVPLRNIREYAVEEHEAKVAMHVGFVLCLPAREQDETERRWLQSVEECGRYRRARDHWAAVKIGRKAPESRTVVAAQPELRPTSNLTLLRFHDNQQTAAKSNNELNVEYSNQPDRISMMLRDQRFEITEASRQKEVDLLLNALLPADASGKLHIIVLVDGTDHQLIQALVEKSAHGSAVVHVIAESADWDPALIESIRMAGGTFQNVSADGLTGMASATYSSLLHHYRLAWTGDVEGLEVEIHAPQGNGVAVAIAPVAYSDSLSSLASS